MSKFKTAGGSSTPSALDVETFGLLISNIRDYGIILFDVNGRVVGWYAGAPALTGYSADEIAGADISRFFTPEDNATGYPQHLLAMAEAQGAVQGEGWRVRKDGSRFWANAVM